MYALLFFTTRSNVLTLRSFLKPLAHISGHDQHIPANLIIGRFPMPNFKAGFWPDRAPSSAETVRKLNAVEEARKAEFDRFFADLLKEAKEKGSDSLRRKAVYFSWLQGRVEEK